MKLEKSLLFALLLVCGQAHAFQVTGSNSLGTQLIVLTGFPEKDQPPGTAVLAPGNVVLLDAATAGNRQAALEITLSRTKVIENLWNTFRLDPVRRTERNVWAKLSPGKSFSISPAENSPIAITTTMVALDAKLATYRVVMKSGDQTLADSTANIALGGRAVFGGRDGDVAPYIFLIVQPARATDTPGVTPPTKLQAPPPVYPESARKEKVMGVVVLEVLIDENGKVANAQTLDSPDARLSEAAINALRQWLFEPARDEEGKAVAARATIEFQFKLQ